MATKHIAKTTYNAEDVERGLQMLALCLGNGREAERQLEKQGLKIPNQVLYGWKREKAQRYGEIRAELTPRVAAVVAADLEDDAIATGEVKRQALVRLSSRIEQDEDISAGDLSNSVSRLAIAQGIAVQRSGELRGRPTVIHEHRSAEDVLEGMRRKGYVIDAKAEEVEVETDDVPA